MDNDLLLLGVLARRFTVRYSTRVYNKNEFTLRTCTSVAGQITLILRSRSRLFPNHPKSHVYYKESSARLGQDAREHKKHTISVLSSSSIRCTYPFSEKKHSGCSESSAVFSIRTIAWILLVGPVGLGKVPRRTIEWVNGSSCKTLMKENLFSWESDFGAAGLDMMQGWR